jgi:hypothetical protein
MVAFLKRPEPESGLDARIAGLTARRGPAPAAVIAPTSSPDPLPPIEPANLVSQEDRLLAARDQLLIKLQNEIRPERRQLLSRGELAKLVDAAMQSYLARHAIEANALEQRDMVTDLMQGLVC